MDNLYGSDYLKEQRRLGLAAIEQHEAEQRMSSLLEKADGDADSVRRNYRLTAVEDEALKKAEAEAARQKEFDDAFLKAFSGTNARNGYSSN